MNSIDDLDASVREKWQRSLVTALYLDQRTILRQFVSHPILRELVTHLMTS